MNELILYTSREWCFIENEDPDVSNMNSSGDTVHAVSSVPWAPCNHLQPEVQIFFSTSSPAKTFPLKPLPRFKWMLCFNGTPAGMMAEIDGLWDGCVNWLRLDGWLNDKHALLCCWTEADSPLPSKPVVSSWPLEGLKISMVTWNRPRPIKSAAGFADTSADQSSASLASTS